MSSMQDLRIAPMPPSCALLQLQLAIANCAEAEQEEMEGHCAPEQLEFLRGFVAQHFGDVEGGAVRMCQIGFNAGHSAVALLEHAPEGSVLLSLDLGSHSYTQPLEQVVQGIAAELGQTHIFLEGDSAEMLPKFRHINFDLFFIDGNHAYQAVQL